jgi:hypothetical protein
MAPGCTCCLSASTCKHRRTIARLQWQCGIYGKASLPAPQLCRCLQRQCCSACSAGAWHCRLLHVCTSPCDMQWQLMPCRVCLARGWGLPSGLPAQDAAAARCLGSGCTQHKSLSDFPHSSVAQAPAAHYGSPLPPYPTRTTAPCSLYATHQCRMHLSHAKLGGSL